MIEEDKNMNRLLCLVTFLATMSFTVHACDNSTYPIFKSCNLHFENMTSVRLQGLRTTNVFLSFVNVTDVVLDDIEMNITTPKASPMRYIRNIYGPGHEWYRLSGILYFDSVSSAVITSSRITGFPRMVQGPTPYIDNMI